MDFRRRDRDRVTLKTRRGVAAFTMKTTIATYLFITFFSRQVCSRNISTIEM